MDDGSTGKEGLSRMARWASIGIALTMVLWMGGQWLGGKLGLETRYVFLIDMLALAGLTWSLFVTWQVWRRQRRN